MPIRFLADQSIDDQLSTPTLKLTSIVNAGTDTDKFLVLDSSGNVDFRTGAEVRSDIGAGTGSGTITGSGTAGRIAKFSTSTALTDSRIFESATGTFIKDSTSFPFTIQNDGSATIVEFEGSATANESNIQIKPGTVSKPGINFGKRSGTGAQDTNTGIYSSAADNLEISTGGTKRIGFNSSGTTLNTLSALSTAASVFLTSDSGVIKTRTAAQVRSDIGAGTGSGTVTGTGTTNNIVKFTNGGSGVIGDSSIADNGTTVSTSNYLNLSKDVAQATFPTEASDYVLQFDVAGTAEYNGGIAWSNGTDTKAGIGVLDTTGSGAVLWLGTQGTSGDVQLRMAILSTGDAQFYESVDIDQQLTVDGVCDLNNIPEIGSDTDKFLMSDGGRVKFVTGDNLRSYIGAGTGSGTVTSVGIAADNGAGTGITTSGTFTFSGGTNMTTSVSGNTVTINTSATTNTGTVTSVATGAGLTGGTITTSGTVAVDYAGTDNFILAAGEGSGTPAGTWHIPLSDGSNNVDYYNVSELPFSDNAGTVTSVAVSGGTGISVSGSPITSSGTITITNTSPNVPETFTGWVVRDDDNDDKTLSGGTNKYLKFTAATGTAGTNLSGTGTSADPYVMAITLPDTNSGGTVTSVATGTYLSGGTITTTGTISHDNTTRSDTTSSDSPGSGGTFTAVDSVTSNATGHVTAINVKTVTMPTSPTVNNGTLTMSTSTGLDGSATFTANQSGNSTFSVSLDLSELTDMTGGMTGTDEFIVLDAGAERRKAANEIGLSIFNNDAGFTTNTGTVTGTGSTNRVAKFTASGTIGNSTITDDGTNVSMTGDLTVNGGDLLLRSSSKVLSNSASSATLLFGDVDASDDTAIIKFMTVGTTQMTVDDDLVAVTAAEFSLGTSTDLTLGSASQIQMSQSATTGSGGSGLSISAGTTSVTAGTVYAMSSFGSWITVANTSANAIRLLAVATGTSSGNGMLTHGVFRKASHGYQLGSPLYLSSTSGTFTTTVPTATNSYARVLGYAISSDDIYFCPDNTWVQNN